MYSPKIKERIIPIIYRIAKEEGRPMTHIVNDILEDYLYKTFYCNNCNNEIEAELGSKEGYCEKCETEVFLNATSR